MKRHFALPLLLWLAACAGPAPYHPPPVPPPPPPPPPPPYMHAMPSPREAEAEPNRPWQPHAPGKVPSAGPLRTAAIGTYMDNQERDLRQHLRGMGVGVGRPGDDIVLNLRNDELFDGNSNQLTGSGGEALTSIAIILRHYDHTMIDVGAFTDTTGTPEQNKAASEKRARVVCDALAAEGVAPGRLKCAGFGEEHLRIATGDHKSEPRNRRTEIRITAAASG